MCLLLVLSLSFLVGSSVSTSLLTDFEALTSLKTGFTFTDPVLDSWDNSSNPSGICSWVGIKCLNGRVVSLDLSNMNLYGSVSPVLSTLESLTDLNLAGNNFSGNIEIKNLSNLQLLNISSNQFDAGLNWNFTSLENLEILDTYDNNFTAPLPIEISDLKKLRHLDLGGNYFFGKIPDSYGNLVNLEYFSVAGNDLEGKIPSELGNLTNLRHMELGYYNVFDGGIPKELGKLVNLVHLDLSNCELHGSVPSELGNLNLLETLFLHTNLLSGSIPKRLSNLTELVNFDLSNNALTGEVPYEFEALKRLKLFNLFMNRLHGSIPEFVSSLPDLETLQLWMNNFTGTIPQNLGQNGKIQNLDLSSNKLTGTIPQNLCFSGQLRILILLKNFLFGSIPESLGSCSTLVRVRLGQNYLNGSIPNGFLYLPELNLVELQENYLSGSLSENQNSLSYMPTKLGQLNLENNLLSGTLPLSLSNFTSLEILLLGGNQFSGPIPPSIGKLKQVLKIDIRGNSISGPIPPEFGKCEHLTYLDLSKNNLSGPIPPQISEIKILNYLNLSRNNLNEDIPRLIGSMKSLTIADFSFNNFSGKLPEFGQFSFFNSSSFAGNPHLCGSFLNNPCNVTEITKELKKGSGEFKLIFALGLLFCSLIFVGGAIVKARSFKKGVSSSWKMTAFHKVDFKVSDVLECMKDGNVIGRGGAGVVYHGKMPNGAEIAVKKLLGFGRQSHDHGFRAEIKTLGSIRHRNIVRLLAFCSAPDTNLLVYSYMRNGSLGDALHGKKGSFLGWNTRYKIAVDAAKGLCYLHHDCSPMIVHRDVKSNNILLGSGFEAHVADFGLAKFLFDRGGDECMSAIAGSYGYIAPEYAYTLRVDEKSDVYSFGVVLLELITGRRPVGDFGEGVDIVQWTKRTTNGKRDEIIRILDPRLSTTVPQEEAMHLFFVAMLCIQENSIERPTMREVVQMLSEFPRHHSSEYKSSSSKVIVFKNLENAGSEKACEKLGNDLLV